MPNPFRSAPDTNSPTALASELAAARQAYIDTRTSVYGRALDRVRALDEVIDEAEQERAEVMNIAIDAENPGVPVFETVPTQPKVGLSD